MPATVTLSDGSTVTVRSEGRHHSREDAGYRVRYRYRVTDKRSRVVLTGADLHSGCGQVPSARDGLTSLLGFLSAAYECGDLTEHGEGYPVPARPWLEEHAEECSVLAFERETIRARYALDIRESVPGDTQPADPEAVEWVDSITAARDAVAQWLQAMPWVEDWHAVLYHGESWDGISFGDMIEAALLITPSARGGIRCERPA